LRRESDAACVPEREVIAGHGERSADYRNPRIVVP
jgi:hypothetical protein